MKIYWSPSVEGFFDSRVNSAIPKDAVEISASYRNELLVGCKHGQVIGMRSNGFPILKEATAPTLEVCATVERQWRDVQLAATDAAVVRHRDESEAMKDTTLSAEQYTRLQAYRVALRNWPASDQFPSVADRPVLLDGGNAAVKKTRARKKT